MNTPDLINELLGSLNPSQKLIVEAVNKMNDGRRLFQEGLLELAHLTEGASRLRGVDLSAPGEAPRAQPPAQKPAPAGGRGISPERDEALAHELLKLLRNEGPHATDNLVRTLHAHYYRLVRVGDKLQAEGRLTRYKTGNTVLWAVPNDTRTAVPAEARDHKPAPEKKDFGKWAGICRTVLEHARKNPSSTATSIARETRRDPKSVRQAIALLAHAGMLRRARRGGVEYLEAVPGAHIEPTGARLSGTRVSPEDHRADVLAAVRACNGWATQLRLSEMVGLSRRPLGEVLKLLRKEGAIRVVEKSHNPAHTDPRSLARVREYLELS